MEKEIIITVDMLGDEGTPEAAEKMAELMSDLGWNISVGETSQNTKFDSDEQYQFDRDWEKCLTHLGEEENATDDRITLVYEESGIRIELGKILTNRSMSVDDALQILGIDMDAFTAAQGWDGWNYEALKLEY